MKNLNYKKLLFTSIFAVLLLNLTSLVFAESPTPTVQVTPEATPTQTPQQTITPTPTTQTTPVITPTKTTTDQPSSATNVSGSSNQTPTPTAKPTPIPTSQSLTPSRTNDASTPVKYTALEPKAFPDIDLNSTSNLSKFLSQIFNFGIAIAVALALIMIIWGGIIKMTTDSWTKQDEGNKKIQNALWGLGMALISWLLLYTINPDLVNFSSNTFLNAPTQTTSK